MQDQTAQVVAALQAAKEKGVSYYDAIQSLKDQGFNQLAIDDATDHFDYQHGALHTPESHPTNPLSDTPVSEKQHLDQELEAEDEQAIEDRREEYEEGFHFRI